MPSAKVARGLLFSSFVAGREFMEEDQMTNFTDGKDLRRVLIVSKDIPRLYALKKLLKEIHYETYLAETLEMAQRLVAMQDFHVLITDARLDDSAAEEGLELIQHIKKNHPDTWVVLATGCGELREKIRADSLGVDFFVSKNIRFSTIYKVLRLIRDRIPQNDAPSFAWEEF
jgi:DNA-binding response OmpR family regulator